MTRVSIGTLAAAIVGCLLVHASLNAADENIERATNPSPLVERFLSRHDPPLASYRAFRTLEAEARGGQMRARLTAWTTLDTVQGFQYWIVEESGSHLVRQKVLRAALEAERTIRATGRLTNAELTPANYEFGGEAGAEGGQIRIRIYPKRRDPMLLEGFILLTGPSAELQQVEGFLSKRPSFWTRDVHVVRRYDRIAGIRVPVSMQSTARVIVAGHSTFSMFYEYASVNGKAVTTPASSRSALSRSGMRQEHWRARLSSWRTRWD